MGNDALAVVDPHLRVHGIDGLRVADVSVAPTLVRGHTAALAMAIGERAADLIHDHTAAPAQVSAKVWPAAPDEICHVADVAPLRPTYRRHHA